MKEATIRALVLDKEGYNIREIVNSLEEFKRIIGCSYIDIRPYTIGGREYDVIFDDEFLLSERAMQNPWTLLHSDFSKNQYSALKGNLIVCKVNQEGEEASLSEYDIPVLYEGMCYIMNSGRPTPCLMMD